MYLYCIHQPKNERKVLSGDKCTGYFSHKGTITFVHQMIQRGNYTLQPTRVQEVGGHRQLRHNNNSGGS